MLFSCVSCISAQADPPSPEGGLFPTAEAVKGDEDYLEGVLAFGQEAYGEAVKSLDRSILAHPDRADAFLLRGVCRLRLGTPSKAKADFERFVEKSEAKGRSMNVVGRLLYDSGCLEEAKAWFRKALATGEDGAATRCNLGSVLIEENRREEAEQYLSEAVRMDPALSEAHVNLGILHFLSGRFSRAETCFKEALRLNAEAGAPDPEVYADLGDLYLVQHVLDAAVEHYIRALDLDPSLSSVRTRLGMALNLRGDRAEARAQFEAAANFGGEPPETHEALAELYLEEGRLLEAVGEYKRAIHLSGEEDPDPLLALARIYAGMGRERAALRIFRMAYRKGAREAEALAELSRLSERCGFPKESLRFFRELEEKTPFAPTVLYALARRCVESTVPGIRDPARAVRLGNRLAEATGWSHAGTLDLLAAAYAACGDWGRAARCEAEAIRVLSGGNPLVFSLRRRLEQYRVKGR